MRRGYKFAVGWVALNDNGGSRDGADEIALYVTTLLVADIFDKDPKKVAADVLKFRQNQQGVNQCLPN